MVQSIRKQTESEDIVLELDEKDSEEAAEEDTKESIKNEAHRASFQIEDKIILETFLK